MLDNNEQVNILIFTHSFFHVPTNHLLIMQTFAHFFSFARRSGRPPKTIPRDLLENLLRLKVPVSEIASFFDVSRLVIYKAIREFQLDYSKFSDLPDDQLQEVVTSIKENHPRAGEVMVQGHLRAQGVYIQRNRLHSAIHQIDPIDAAERRRPPI